MPFNQYAQGFVSGNLVNDSLEIQSLFKVSNFTFLLVDHELGLDGTIPDGVLGLGFEPQADSPASLINTLKKQNIIKTREFSLYLTSSPVDSRILFGDIFEDSSFQRIKDKMSSCQVTKGGFYWACSLRTVAINGINVKLNSEVVFDSGTSYIILPYTDFKLIKQAFLKNFQCGISNFNRIMCKCSSPNDFPVLELAIGNGVFKLFPADYVEFFPMYQDYQCRFQLMVDVFTENLWILGDTAIRHSIITFNNEINEIKFYQSAEKLLINEEASEQSNFWFYAFLLLLIFTVAYIAIRK